MTLFDVLQLAFYCTLEQITFFVEEIKNWIMNIFIEKDGLL